VSVRACLHFQGNVNEITYASAHLRRLGAFGVFLGGRRKCGKTREQQKRNS
jgi:hypothetical protein